MPDVSNSYIVKWTRQHWLISYILVAYSISWVLELPLVASSQHWIEFQVPSEWHLSGALGPFLAAIIMTGLVSGKAGIRDLFGRMRHWKVGVLWFFLAVLSPAALLLAATLINGIFGNNWPNFSKLWSNQYSWLGWLSELLLIPLAYGFGEEPGWRGFVLPRLQARHNVLTATALLALIWGLWHTPMFFYRFNFDLGIVFGFFFSLFLGAIWFTLIYNSTGGSLLMVAVFHSLWDIVNIAAKIVSPDLLITLNVLFVIMVSIAFVASGPLKLSTEGKEVIADSDVPTIRLRRQAF